jgi:GDP-L-fucose synthase
MNRVAILGGTGFVGTNVRRRLETAGMEVAAFSRTTGCDLRDMPAAWKALDAFRPTVIVNCAAIVGSVNYVSDFAAEVIDENMRIIMNTYKIAQQMHDVVVMNPVANCGYPGVMDVYVEDRFWDGPVHPSVLSYGSTRRMMLSFSECYRRQFGVRSVNLIVPNIYGPEDSTNPNKTHALNALVIKFVNAVKHRLPSIEIWGTGRPVREWLYVRDFAAVVERVISAGDFVPTPVNIAQNSGQTVKELVDILVGLTGYGGEITYNAAYQDGAPRKVMDDARFRERFPGFSFTDIREGIRETMLYYMSILQ